MQVVCENIFTRTYPYLHKSRLDLEMCTIKKPHRSGARKVFSMSKSCRLKQIPHPTCVGRCSTCVDADYATSARQHNQPYKNELNKEDSSPNILSGLQFQFTTYDEINILVKLATELRMWIVFVKNLEHT